MSGLLEVVFEGVNKTTVYDLAKALLNNARRIDVEYSKSIKLTTTNRELDHQYIDSFINQKNDDCIIVKLQEFRVKRIVIPFVLLRILKYGTKYDIDYNFDDMLEDKDKLLLLDDIYEHTVSLGEQYKVDSWFFGLEPASDEETRFFTKLEFGPL